MTTTTGTTYCLRRQLERDFATACSQLAEARRRQSHEDSTGNRAAVAESRERIDAILDMHLEADDLGGPSPHEGGGAATVARSQAAVMASVVGRSNSGPS
jgi:hypothetical protein